ncbi:hypothetical protein Poly51_56440 [Rubripirellula tenax]|uniref:Uncharacterized protein n=1 Tax=Rubripirellula tenax TaxID=2528015 RepID=A0A5C6EBI3_9BACT|nr:hypothetical protein [Rubripirellula tenax]TWU46248.1 hypothetical protein Poly51_56440 [Rubripirellula tenax]
MTKYVLIACSLFMISAVGCEEPSAKVVVDKDEAKALYDSPEIRAKEAAAEAAAQREAAAGGTD